MKLSGFVCVTLALTLALSPGICLARIPLEVGGATLPRSPNFLLIEFQHNATLATLISKPPSQIGRTGF